MSDAELFSAERRRLRVEYAGLFEVGTILPRLKHCTSEADVTRVVHEEFCHWFGAGPEDAGLVERYAKVSAEIWQLWSAR